MPKGIYERKSLVDRFWEKVQVHGPSECWEWTASKNTYGYGHIWVDGKMKQAHRFSYELHKGPIPDGLHILHICDNPSCCNPVHLHLGTHQDNMRERGERGRGRSASGQSNGRSKLTTETVRQIRDRYATGTVTQLELGREFGVSHSLISHIVNRKNWKHVI